jgi:hypothetical protein
MTLTMSASGSNAGRVLLNRISGERDVNQPQVCGQTESFVLNASNTLNSGEAEQG